MKEDPADIIEIDLLVIAKREDHTTSSTTTIKMVILNPSENITRTSIDHQEKVASEVIVEAKEVASEAIVEAKEVASEAIAEVTEVASEVEKANHQDITTSKEMDLPTPSIINQELLLVFKTNLRTIQISFPAKIQMSSMVLLQLKLLPCLLYTSPSPRDRG